MERFIFADAGSLGAAAAGEAGQQILSAIRSRKQADIILATGTSQLKTLDALVTFKGIDWSKVTMFHLDEYIGLPDTHKASFRKYLREQFVARVPKLAAAHFVCGDAPDPEAECRRLGQLISATTIDVALVGIGENGHLAFNDPPADFDTEEPYIIVNLDERCRRQQLGEGWFSSFEDVPSRAISMGIRQILKSRHIVCSVPDQRKAEAVRNTLEGPVLPNCPASILRTHPSCRMYLDEPAASLLKNQKGDER
ncbi:MAG: glucosamine-6-phosphate deaminase [Phycisphaerae bacterium]|nr:glucosamine-6-phosphate deaminase [Phycisphaerae bacterium]